MPAIQINKQDVIDQIASDTESFPAVIDSQEELNAFTDSIYNRIKTVNPDRPYPPVKL